jgi:lipoprotein-anchoring transpeptidase ErfK/SrfK
MTSSSPETKHRARRGLVLAFLIGALMIILTLCVALAVTPSLAGAFVGISSPTARPLSWSVVEIAKPTYTPFPKPASAPTQTNLPASEPPPTDIPPLITMNIVEDSNSSSLGAQGYSPNAMDSAAVYSRGKYILVSISEQHLSAYDNGQLVYSFIASTGMGNSTRLGKFSVLDKIPNAYGATWNIWMPNWLGIYYAGSLEDGIHALPILPSGDRLWSGYLGTPISFGCVVLGIDESLQLYDWADIGTPVEIQR